MRNSDWSSDVCSSDLRWPEGFHHFSAVRYDINLCNPVIRMVCIGIADDDVKTETGWALQGGPHDNVVYRVPALDILFQGSIRATLFHGIQDGGFASFFSQHKGSGSMTGNASKIVIIIAAYRSEEHKSELQSLMRNSYASIHLKKKQKD